MNIVGTSRRNFQWASVTIWFSTYQHLIYGGGWVLKANHGFIKLVSRPTHCWNFYLWSSEQPHIYGEPAKLQNKEDNQNKCVWKDIREGSKKSALLVAIYY